MIYGSLLGVPKTIGFNTKMVQVWMIWGYLGYPLSRTPPYVVILYYMISENIWHLYAFMMYTSATFRIMCWIGSWIMLDDVG